MQPVDFQNDRRNVMSKQPAEHENNEEGVTLYPKSPQSK